MRNNMKLLAMAWRRRNSRVRGTVCVCWNQIDLTEIPALSRDVATRQKQTPVFNLHKLGIQLKVRIN